jgi:hypothetical protein
MPRIVLTVDGETVYDSGTNNKNMTNNNTSGEGNNGGEEYPQLGGKKGKKAKKAKGTRKLSPYMKFAQEARPKILKENPEMKSDIIGVGRKIGEMWRALSDSEKARY